MAAVVRIVREVESRGPLGKKKLQKLIHLAQEASDIPIDYKFSFYTYGAFSAELASDIDRLAYWQALTVAYDPDSNAYSIESVADAPAIEARAGAFLQANEERLQKVIADFGSRPAKELELLSTLVFLKRRIDDKRDEKIVEQTTELKPHFTTLDARKGVQELRKLGYWH